MTSRQSKIEKLIAELCPKGVEFRELDKLGDFYGGLTGKNKENFTNGNAKFISYKNIFENISVDTDIDTFVKISSREKQNKIEYGDVLFTGSSETPNECGMSSVLTTKTDEPLYLNSFSFGFRFYDPESFLPSFLKYLFRNEKIRKQIVKTASGVTRFNISKKLFAKISIPLPPLIIQKEIVRILDTFTELTTELTARKKQYSYYRDQLLTFEEDRQIPFIRKLLDGAAVEQYPLGAIVNTITAPAKLKKEDYREIGTIPIIDQGASFIKGYTDKNVKALPADEYIIFGDHSEHIKYVDFSFIQGADGLKILKAKSDSARYIYHAFQNFYQKELSYKRHWSKAKNTLIPIPPLTIQKEIVRILDKFDTLTHSISEGLPREIALRKKQYEYYRDLLLNFSKSEAI